MKKSKLFRTLTLAVAAALCMATTTVTAYAGGADPDPVPLPETTEAPAEVPEKTEEPTTGGMEPEGVPVTPQGNATLVDDFFGDKQLITVTTKAGNYFYILIDRANEDKETAVHFLNQVDDADLQDLLEHGKKEPEVCTCTAKCQAGAVNTACPVCKNNLTACNGPEPKPQPEEEKPQEEKPSGMGGLVCATDAGREGELIFRFVYQMAGCKKPFQRLWISSMEDAAIKDGFAHLKPGTDYDNLYQSALCRAQADWLVGINATRLFSILYHKTLTVGRVQTPTLKMLVDREAKISSFQKEKYHIVQIAAGGMEAASERMGNAADAKALKAACELAQAVCVSVTREKKTEQPPRLYDLTTLQREANRLFGFTAKQTLDYAQQLYEKKLLTYPRTDSQYLTDDMLPTAESLVSGLWPLLPFAAGLDLSPQFGRVLNSKKVSDHHAIVPTMEFVQKGFDGLAEGEKKLLSLVCCKLLCAVAAPHVYEAVTATFTCAGDTFTAKGKTILTPGWKELDRRFKASFKTDADDTAPEPVRELPEITESQTFDKVTAAVTEHFTAPPKSYTDVIHFESRQWKYSKCKGAG